MRTTLLALLFVPLIAVGQDKKAEPKKDDKKPPRIAIHDPAKLKDDVLFQSQGEFIQKGMKLDVGIHVIAASNDTLTSRSYVGGLPGDGWNLGDEPLEKGRPKLAGIRDGKKIKLMMGDREAGDITDGVMTIGDGTRSITVKRVERKSPTLGAKPPAGAVVLFDKPEDIANWEKCKVEELSDGKFLGVGGRTKQKFQSFTLHLEFRLPWMPNSTGQQRGNSGVYIQDRYEVQVLDSFGLEGKDNECGGIYKESKPKVNMCFPPMTWQTYDIDFTAATFENGKKTKPAVITVKHNGVVIHDKLELKSNTPGGGITKEVPEAGAIYLQNHGDPVVYRNIWIVEKK